MRVLHIASGDLWAGAEVQLFNLACALRKRSDIALEVALFNHGALEQRLREMSVPTTVFDEHRLGSLAILRELIRLIQAQQPHIVHTHRDKDDVLGSLASLACRTTVAVCTVHGAEEFTLTLSNLRRSLALALEWLCNRLLCKRVVCVSQHLKCIHRGFPQRQLSVIDNGIDIELVERDSSEQVTLPGDAGRKRIGFFGRMVPVKRVDLIVETARRLQARHRDRYAFFLFGDGPDSESVACQIEKCGLRDSVHMMGFVPNTAPYLRLMNALLLTSDHEGMPMIVLEAMCLQVPVISHAVGAIPEMLDNGRMGTLVGTQEPEDYVRAIETCMTSDATRRTKCDAAYAHVRDRYSADRTCSEYVRLYQDVMKHECP
jgi:glycosyltransferase involved in cell wall biosynthesis